jgi:Reverse transcriptase (RNA-dependent DNA polymerase).
MINGLGKIYERLLVDRIVKHLDDTGGISDAQYGFRRGVSTIDAIEAIDEKVWRRIEARRYTMAVGIDIRNAFNTVKWKCVMEAVRRREVPEYLVKVIRHYLTNRRITVDTDEGVVERRVTRGVPQGSVIGPLLWNITFDDLLRHPRLARHRVSCFADDTLIVVSGETLEATARRTQRASNAAIEWIENRGMSVAPEKTETIVFDRKRKRMRNEERITGIKIKEGEWRRRTR